MWWATSVRDMDQPPLDLALENLVVPLWRTAGPTPGLNPDALLAPV
jgi:hypothetical protein